jgi:hypothetical protein
MAWQQCCCIIFMLLLRQAPQAVPSTYALKVDYYEEVLQEILLVWIFHAVRTHKNRSDYKRIFYLLI